MSGPGFGYVNAGYGISAAVLVLYAFRIVARGRRLSRQVPPETQPWR